MACAARRLRERRSLLARCESSQPPSLRSARRARRASGFVRSYVSLDRDDPYVLAYLRKNHSSGDAILIVLNMSGEPRSVTFDLASLGLKGSFAKTLLAAPEIGQDSPPLAQFTIAPFGVFVGSVH